MPCPIIIAAFGTTRKTRAVYASVDAHLKACFPEHEIHWAYTSRIVRHQLKKRQIETPDPVQVINRLAQEGHQWAVVQSFNMICGHEFYRLVSEVQHENCRVSIGHSLLCRQEDHRDVVDALAPVFAKDHDEAVVLVGHGTDHCIWTVYPAIYQRFRQTYGKRAFGGMIEEDYPGRDALIQEVKKAGFKRARLAPFMLVAGVHFSEDLAGPEDSWKTTFEAHGIEVMLETSGLASLPAIIDIFVRHIQGALDVIPDRARLMTP